MDKAVGSPIGELNIMDKSGHKQLKWNQDQESEIRAAQETFNLLIRNGYSAFGAKTTSEPMHSVRDFDPTLEKTIMVPKIVGG